MTFIYRRSYEGECWTLYISNAVIGIEYYTKSFSEHSTTKEHGIKYKREELAWAISRRAIERHNNLQARRLNHVRRRRESIQLLRCKTRKGSFMYRELCGTWR